MYLRLAFSVAAHMEPEILMIDEVLAVGDAAFQKKCLGKMGDVAKGGRTVLFVSHSFVAVESLCPRTLLVHQGALAADGKTREVIDKYLTDISCSSGTLLSDRKDRQGAGEIRTTAIEFLDHKGNIIQHPVSGQELIIRMHYESLVDKEFINCEASIAVTRNEVPYFILSTEVVDTRQLDLSGSGYIDFVIPELPLSQSTYALHSCIKSNREVHDWVVGAAEMSVVDGDFYGIGKSYPSGLQGRGVLVRHSWRRRNGNAAVEK
jgi:lipopolysaccharide transport system ATP-binding protein